jgi:hypothetical protein
VYTFGSLEKRNDRYRWVLSQRKGDTLAHQSLRLGSIAYNCGRDRGSRFAKGQNIALVVSWVRLEQYSRTLELVFPVEETQEAAPRFDIATLQE